MVGNINPYCHGFASLFMRVVAAFFLLAVRAKCAFHIRICKTIQQIQEIHVYVTRIDVMLT
jgi:hypothetical protein